MIKEINEIINNLEQTLGWCDRITTGNLPHKIGNLKQCLVSTIELLKVLNLGWHPASELPKKPINGVGRIIVITFDDEYGVNHYANGWNMDNIKWWCYPPKED